MQVVNVIFLPKNWWDNSLMPIPMWGNFPQAPCLFVLDWKCLVVGVRWRVTKNKTHFGDEGTGQEVVTAHYEQKPKAVVSDGLSQTEIPNRPYRFQQSMT